MRGAYGLLLLGWAACARDPVAAVCPQIGEGDLVVTEIRGPQKPDDLNGPWVELFNASSGTITVAVGTSATISPTNFSNAGGMVANGTSVSLTPTGTYANAGTLALNSGTLNLGGAFVFNDLASGHYTRAVTSATGN